MQYQMEKIKYAKIVQATISSSLGNILEWYDFGLFTIFSVLFAKIYFPTNDPQTAIIATFGIFSIGFICRPIGALLFGYLGDKFGRAKTLRFSILMISIPTLLIGLLPTYHQIGIAAPIFLTLIRMWQGLSIGGEYSGNLIYLAESAPDRYRATFTSFACVGANLGILLATLVGLIISHLFSSATLESWGWRLAYIVSGIFCLLMYIYRLHLPETQVFNYLKAKHELVKNPIKIAFKQDYLQILRTLGLVCMGTTFYYFCFVYIPIFLTERLGYSIDQISKIMSIYIFCMLLLVPIAGWICDQLGRRTMLLFNSALVMLSIVPSFYLLQENNLMSLVLVLGLFVTASALEQATTSIAVVENFPATARYTGLSFGYNLGNGFLGGTVPVICAWLLARTGFMLAPAIYIGCFALITFLVTYFFVPETLGKSLR